MNPTLTTIYTQTNEKIEKMVETMNFWLVKLTAPFCTIPTILGSFITFYTSNLGADAFELPLATMWYVLLLFLSFISIEMMVKFSV